MCLVSSWVRTPLTPPPPRCLRNIIVARSLVSFWKFLLDRFCFPVFFSRHAFLGHAFVTGFLPSPVTLACCPVFYLPRAAGCCVYFRIAGSWIGRGRLTSVARSVDLSQVFASTLVCTCLLLCGPPFPHVLRETCRSNAVRVLRSVGLGCGGGGIGASGPAAAYEGVRGGRRRYRWRWWCWWSGTGAVSKSILYV